MPINPTISLDEISLESHNLQRLYRLSHDTLGPIVRKLYSDSNLLGQRATRILDSKKQDIENWNGTEPLFSEVDTKTLKEGWKGMRTWQLDEKNAISYSQNQLSQQRIELEKQRKKAVQALAEGLAKEAEISLRNNLPTQALQLAEKAYQYAIYKSKVLATFLKVYYKNNAEQYDGYFDDHLDTILEDQKESEHPIKHSSISPGGGYVIISRDKLGVRLISIDDGCENDGYIDLSKDTYTFKAVFSPYGSKSHRLLTASGNWEWRIWDLRALESIDRNALGMYRLKDKDQISQEICIRSSTA